VVHFIASFELPILTDHLSLFGFAGLALVLLVLVAFDMRRAIKATAKKNSSMQFLSPHRDEYGMPIFFEAGEDPLERAAHRVIARKRRHGAAR
jgi:hypothetical protein